MKRMILAVFALFLSCDRRSASSRGIDLDQIPKRNSLGSLYTERDMRIVDNFERKSGSSDSLSIPEILSAQNSYKNSGDLELVRKLFVKIRRSMKFDSAADSSLCYFAALNLESAFLDFQQWDSAWHYLDVADSFWHPSFAVDPSENVNRNRYDRSVILEQRGEAGEIMKLWRNQCLGRGEEILARALRRKFGKERIKEELEEAMKHPVVESANLKLLNGRYMREMVPHLPDGDSAYMIDFGGLFVRVDLPKKSCYLWAPSQEDSIFNVQAYLNNFRETRFCKILQDIDPDARE